MKVIKEPNISRDDTCFGYADAHPNARGDLGLVLAWGGSDKNGKRRALRSGVGIIDEFSPGYHVHQVYSTSVGTDMPSKQREHRRVPIRPVGFGRRQRRDHALVEMMATSRARPLDATVRAYRRSNHRPAIQADLRPAPTAILR